jgi:hypothetical protein
MFSKSSALLIFITLIHVHIVAGVCINCLKVLRLRWFIDADCTELSPYGTILYSSIDGSCLCLSTIATWSKDSQQGGCESSYGFVVGNTYSATFTQNNGCWKDDGTYNRSGTLNECKIAPFADVVYINRPLYIWQWLAVSIGGLLVIVALIIVLCKRCKRNRYSNSSEFLMYAVVQSDG